MGFVEHNPLLIHRPAWEAMLASRPEEIHRTRMQRFRSDDDLWPDKWYRYFLLTHRNVRTKAVPAWRVLRFNRLHKIKNDLEGQRRELERLQRMRPRFYCMNDDQGAQPDAAVTATVKAFLASYYPQPSSFER